MSLVVKTVVLTVAEMADYLVVMLVEQWVVSTEEKKADLWVDNLVDK